jgi:predicted ArsR family transcriptional regulator
MVSLVRAAYGDEAPAAAEEQGAKKGRELGRPFQHPSPEQTAREVADTLERLSFAPGPVLRRKNVLSMDLAHCPFRIDPTDPDGALVCAFHEGLIRGMAETSGGGVFVRVRPFAQPGVCRVELHSGNGNGNGNGHGQGSQPVTVKPTRKRTTRPAD